MRKKIVALLIAILLLISLIPLITVTAATEDEIEKSIQDGLDWLVPQQNPDGSWGEGYVIAKTGLTVLKLIDRAKEIPGIEGWNDPNYVYHDEVIDGLRFLFSQGYYVPIAVQPAGDPDTLANGLGVRFTGFDDYETSVALMALGATMTPSIVVNTTGPLNGTTYADVVQDIVDYLSYNQRESTWARGGWGYEGNADWADNSVSGYASLGLGYAQAFGATIPQFVKDELTHWIGLIQSPAGYSYYRPPAVWGDPYGDLLLRTGNLLYQMALVGMPVSDPQVQLALSYIDNNWDLSGNVYQRAFCLMKGLEAYGITDEISVGVSGDWFDELSTFIVDTQNASGNWPNDPHDWDDPYPMTAAWALLTLERTVAVPLIEVDIDIKPGSWPNPFNKKAKGVFAVAICGTEEFDVTTIDPASVMISLDLVNGTSPVKWHLEDAATPFNDTTPDDPDGHEMTGDGIMDLVLHFSRQEVVELGLCEYETGDYVKLYIMGYAGESGEGVPFQGFDWVRVKK